MRTMVRIVVRIPYCGEDCGEVTSGPIGPCAAPAYVAMEELFTSTVQCGTKKRVNEGLLGFSESDK